MTPGSHINTVIWKSDVSTYSVRDGVHRVSGNLSTGVTFYLRHYRYTGHSILVPFLLGRSPPLTPTNKQTIYEYIMNTWSVTRFLKRVLLRKLGVLSDTRRGKVSTHITLSRNSWNGFSVSTIHHLDPKSRSVTPGSKTGELVI